MAKASLPLSILFLSLLLMSLASGMTAGKSQNCKRTWCVAKASTENSSLASTLNFVCSMYDCSPIREGGACFEPDTYIAHASWAMNLYYTLKGGHPSECYFSNTGLTTTTDPSYDQCQYN